MGSGEHSGGNLGTVEYKHVILGLIFLKYVSNKKVQFSSPFAKRIWLDNGKYGCVRRCGV
jgi:hypothetical protein